MKVCKKIIIKENKSENFVKLHEAGINEIKIKESITDTNIFYIFTCGEDCTLIISEFNIISNKMNIINENIENSNESSIQNIQIDLNNNNNDDENKKQVKKI